MAQTTISVSPEIRDQIRDLKGVERTYDDVIRELIEQSDPDATRTEQ